MDRRTFLSASAIGAFSSFGSLAFAQSGPQQPPDPAAPSDRLAAAISAARMPIDFDGRTFSGPGYDWLLARGSEAGAFLLGEEHGIAENPKLAAQLFAALVPHGYRNVAIEISPPMAAAVDRALAAADPNALTRLLTTPESRVAFFGLSEEADWLRAARSALPGRGPFLWGLDYELTADRYLIAQLKGRPLPAAAARRLSELEAASAQSWARYEQTRNPQFIYSFAGDPKLVQNLRSAWPNADAGARTIMDTLEQTFAINALWAANQGYASNLLRSRFIRSNLLRYWKAREGHDANGRLFMKMGASHLVRGLNFSDVFDAGTLVPEWLEQAGRNSFHLLVLPGPGAQTANLDPTQFRYVPGNRNEYGEDMGIFDRSVVPGKFTLYDMAPLRPLASSTGKDVPPRLWRAIHGFDAVLVMTGSHPSTNL